MAQKRILIVSKYPLFDQGLRAALSRQPGVEVLDVCRDLETAHRQAEALRPDALVLFAGPEVVRESTFHLLEDLSPSIIRISPGDATMQVFRRQQVDQATLDDLLAAIQASAMQWKTSERAELPAQPVPPTAYGYPTRQRRDGMKHFIIVAVLVIVTTALVSLGLQSARLLPQVASEEGALVDGLFGLHLNVIAFLFSLIVIFTLYSVAVFRRKAGDTGDGAHIHGSSKLEIIWTVIPLITVLFFGVLGTRQLGQISAAEPDELVVEVTAQQFAWRFDYPGYNIPSSPELYLPRGRQVLFRFHALDVIHSFWVPEFRIKQDAVPGMTTTLRIKPTQVGEYKVRCAELCGTAHYSMETPVKVVEPADFEAWLASQTQP